MVKHQVFVCIGLLLPVLAAATWIRLNAYEKKGYRGPLDPATPSYYGHAPEDLRDFYWQRPDLYRQQRLPSKDHRPYVAAIPKPAWIKPSNPRRYHVINTAHGSAPLHQQQQQQTDLWFYQSKDLVPPAWMKRIQQTTVIATNPPVATNRTIPPPSTLWVDEKVHLIAQPVDLFDKSTMSDMLTTSSPLPISTWSTVVTDNAYSASQVDQLNSQTLLFTPESQDDSQFFESTSIQSEGMVKTRKDETSQSNNQLRSIVPEKVSEATLLVSSESLVTASDINSGSSGSDSVHHFSEFSSITGPEGDVVKTDASIYFASGLDESSIGGTTVESPLPTWQDATFRIDSTGVDKITIVTRKEVSTLATEADSQTEFLKNKLFSSSGSDIVDHLPYMTSTTEHEAASVQASMSFSALEMSRSTIGEATVEDSTETVAVTAVDIESDSSTLKDMELDTESSNGGEVTIIVRNAVPQTTESNVQSEFMKSEAVEATEYLTSDTVAISTFFSITNLSTDLHLTDSESITEDATDPSHKLSQFTVQILSEATTQVSDLQSPMPSLPSSSVSALSFDNLKMTAATSGTTITSMEDNFIAQSTVLNEEFSFAADQSTLAGTTSTDSEQESKISSSVSKSEFATESLDTQMHLADTTSTTNDGIVDAGAELSSQSSNHDLKFTNEESIVSQSTEENMGLHSIQGSSQTSLVSIVESATVMQSTLAVLPTSEDPTVAEMVLSSKSSEINVQMDFTNAESSSRVSSPHTDSSETLSTNNEQLVSSTRMAPTFIKNVESTFVSETSKDPEFTEVESSLETTSGDLEETTPEMHSTLSSSTIKPVAELLFAISAATTVSVGDQSEVPSQSGSSEIFRAADFGTTMHESVSESVESFYSFGDGTVGSTPPFTKLQSAALHSVDEISTTGELFVTKNEMSMESQSSELNSLNTRRITNAVSSASEQISTISDKATDAATITISASDEFRSTKLTFSSAAAFTTEDINSEDESSSLFSESVGQSRFTNAGSTSQISSDSEQPIFDALVVTTLTTSVETGNTVESLMSSASSESSVDVKLSKMGSTLSDKTTEETETVKGLTTGSTPEQPQNLLLEDKSSESYTSTYVQTESEKGFQSTIPDLSVSTVVEPQNLLSVADDGTGSRPTEFSDVETKFVGSTLTTSVEIAVAERFVPSQSTVADEQLTFGDVTSTLVTDSVARASTEQLGSTSTNKISEIESVSTFAQSTLIDATRRNSVQTGVESASETSFVTFGPGSWSLVSETTPVTSEESHSSEFSEHHSTIAEATMPEASPLILEHMNRQRISTLHWSTVEPLTRTNFSSSIFTATEESREVLSSLTTESDRHLKFTKVGSTFTDSTTGDSEQTTAVSEDKQFTLITNEPDLIVRFDVSSTTEEIIAHNDMPRLSTVTNADSVSTIENLESGLRQTVYSTPLQSTNDHQTVEQFTNSDVTSEVTIAKRELPSQSTDPHGPLQSSNLFSRASSDSYHVTDETIVSTDATSNPEKSRSRHRETTSIDSTNAETFTEKDETVSYVPSHTFESNNVNTLSSMMTTGNAGRTVSDELSTSSTANMQQTDLQFGDASTVGEETPVVATELSSRSSTSFSDDHFVDKRTVITEATTEQIESLGESPVTLLEFALSLSTNPSSAATQSSDATLATTGDLTILQRMSPVASTIFESSEGASKHDVTDAETVTVEDSNMSTSQLETATNCTLLSTTSAELVIAARGEFSQTQETANTEFFAEATTGTITTSGGFILGDQKSDFTNTVPTQKVTEMEELKTSNLLTSGGSSSEDWTIEASTETTESDSTRALANRANGKSTVFFTSPLIELMTRSIRMQKYLSTNDATAAHSSEEVMSITSSDDILASSQGTKSSDNVMQSSSDSGTVNSYLISSATRAPEALHQLASSGSTESNEITERQVSSLSTESDEPLLFTNMESVETDAGNSVNPEMSSSVIAQSKFTSIKSGDYTVENTFTSVHTEPPIIKLMISSTDPQLSTNQLQTLEQSNSVTSATSDAVIIAQRELSSLSTKFEREYQLVEVQSTVTLESSTGENPENVINISSTNGPLFTVFGDTNCEDIK